MGFPEVVAGKGYLHADCDGGAVLAKKNGKGYYYASNSEDKPDGGVYVIETDNDHVPVDFYHVLAMTEDNCAGGPTPWDTWYVCERSRMPFGSAFLEVLLLLFG